MEVRIDRRAGIVDSPLWESYGVTLNSPRAARRAAPEPEHAERKAEQSASPTSLTAGIRRFLQTLLGGART